MRLLQVIYCKMPYAVLYAICDVCLVWSLDNSEGREVKAVGREDYNQEKGDAGVDVDCRSGHCKKKMQQRETETE